MKIFFVTVLAGEEIHALAERMISEAHELYVPQMDGDGVQDPYRAVDDSDAVVWLYSSSNVAPLGMADYNHLYGDTVMQRAIRTGIPVLYYHFTKSSDPNAPAILTKVTRHRSVRDLVEFEEYLRNDLRELVSGNIQVGD